MTDIKDKNHKQNVSLCDSSFYPVTIRKVVKVERSFRTPEGRRIEATVKLCYAGSF